jgi:hypothetical protein
MIAGILSLIVLSSALIAPTMVRAQSDKSADDDYRTYEKTQVLAAELFANFLKENIATLRVSALLKHCQKEGLANAVDAKLIDRKLTDKITALIAEGRFDGLPPYAAYEAQSAAGGDHRLQFWSRGRHALT